MAHTSKEAASKEQGGSDPVNVYRDRDPGPITPPPDPSPGVDVSPPSRGNGDDEQ